MVARHDVRALHAQFVTVARRHQLGQHPGLRQAEQTRPLDVPIDHQPGAGGLGHAPTEAERQSLAQLFGRHALQPVETLLRQQRTAIAQAAHVLEEFGAQVGVALQRFEQHRIGGRHGAEARGRQLAQILQRLLEAARDRPSAVDVERTRDADDAVQVGVAAPGVMPGQPVERHGDAAVVERLADRPDHLDAGGEIAVGVEHALGHAGGAGGEEDLGRRIGCDVLAPLGDGGIDRAGGERAEGKAAPAVHRDHAGAGPFGTVERRSVDFRVLCENQSRLDDAQRMVEACEVAGQRVIGRDRCYQHARAQCAEQEEGVLQTVVGEDRNRLGPRAEALCDQPGGDGARLHPGIGVGQPLPRAVRATALREERDVGPAHGRPFQPVDDERQVGRQRASGRKDQNAVSASLDRDRWLRPVERAHGRHMAHPVHPPARTLPRSSVRADDPVVDKLPGLQANCQMKRNGPDNEARDQRASSSFFKAMAMRSVL